MTSSLIYRTMYNGNFVPKYALSHNSLSFSIYSIYKILQLPSSLNRRDFNFFHRSSKFMLPWAIISSTIQYYLQNAHLVLYRTCQRICYCSKYERLNVDHWCNPIVLVSQNNGITQNIYPKYIIWAIFHIFIVFIIYLFSIPNMVRPQILSN